MTDTDIAREGLADALEAIAHQRTPVGAQRTCPDCGRPQHYTGTEHGWAHDALIDTWHCADPRKDPWNDIR